MANNLEQMANTIIKVIGKKLRTAIPASDLTQETGLVGSGLTLDSVAILDLLTGLEDELDIMIDESLLEQKDLANIENLALFISKL